MDLVSSRSSGDAKPRERTTALIYIGVDRVMGSAAVGGYIMFRIGAVLARLGANLNLVFDPLHPQFLARQRKADPARPAEAGQTHRRS